MLACALTRLAREVLQTFFGGTIAIADLGVTEMCLLVSDFSPLTERRNACVSQVKS